MSRDLRPEPLIREAFAPFGDVLAFDGAPSFAFNAGMAERWHDLARVDFGPGGRAALSLGRSKPRVPPFDLDLLERHPLGSQAFLPLAPVALLVVVAPDEDGESGRPRAFLGAPGVGVNFLRGTWHGVLSPLAPCDVVILDREGPGANLEERRLAEPWRVLAAAGEA